MQLENFRLIRMRTKDPICQLNLKFQLKYFLSGGGVGGATATTTAGSVVQFLEHEPHFRCWRSITGNTRQSDLYTCLILRFLDPHPYF